MQTFIYMGVIANYEIIDGKVYVSSVDYDGEQHKCDHTFNKIGELRRFIEIGGWKTENN